MMLDVSFLPSLPARGESFTVIETAIVGGSIGVAGTGSVKEVSQIVSATEASVIPAIQIISPAATSVAGTLLMPAKVNNFDKRNVSTVLPSRFMAFTGMFIFAVPDTTRPTRIRP